MATTRLNMPNGLSDNATAMTVFVDHDLPWAAPFYCTFETGETVKVTAGGRDVDQWTVVRGRLDTTAVPHRNDEWLTVSIGREITKALDAGGGGGGLPPGVTGDGRTPGGLNVAGNVIVGQQFVTGAPTSSQFYGWVSIDDTPTNSPDGDGVLYIRQRWAVDPDGFGAAAVFIHRFGDISAADYGHPTVRIADDTASAQPALEVQKGGVTQLRVHATGITVAGSIEAGNTASTAPAAHQLYGSTIVRDTDANNGDFGGELFFVGQGSPIPNGGFGGEAAWIERTGDISAQDYGRPTLRVSDTTASTQPVLSVEKGGVAQLQVNDGTVIVAGDLVAGLDTVGTGHTFQTKTGGGILVRKETDDYAGLQISLSPGSSGGEVEMDNPDLGVVWRVNADGSENLSGGLGVWAHAAPSTQPTLATGAGHTTDDVIAMLQTYGICKQS